MKKIFILLVLIIISTPAFAANWVEFFEKKYIDIEAM